ncbi:hypothetical protein C0J52_00373 [Blattella germanica]|nr:hypothetical protein C0J52_00373 [Blattella germanica]
MFCGTLKGLTADKATQSSYKVYKALCLTLFSGSSDQYSYRPSLLNAPDLPSWIHYLYSNRHQTGFLYGVPPPHHGSLELEIVGLNRENYETRRRVVHMNVQEKAYPATHEVQLKIDNLNVEDMFDSYRQNRLLDVVVVRIGSKAQFSSGLIELQDEVKPLWKLGSCPRDFKRTTVERFFRDEGFALDWCAFRLIISTALCLTCQFPLLQIDAASATHQHLPSTDFVEDRTPLVLSREDRWVRPSKLQVPQRSYVSEFVHTIMLPMLVMIILVLLLSVILCFHHEGISKRQKDTPAVQMVQYTAVHRATNTLRSLSSQREVPGEHENSLPRTSTPRMSMEYGTYYRPNPPPYTGSVQR